MNRHDISRDRYMLTGPLSRKGYDWWWHSFTAVNRKTGEEKAFYIEFFIINPALGAGRTEPVLGQNPANRQNNLKPSYLMVNVGTWGTDHRQLHRFFPISDVSIAYGNEGFSVEADDCYLSETFTRGSICCDGQQALDPGYMCDEGDIIWDLTIKKITAFNVGYGASRFFRKINAFEMFWHAEGIKTEYQGIITYCGEAYDVIPERCFGYADKNWGSDFTSPWVWLSSCDIRSIVYVQDDRTAEDHSPIPGDIEIPLEDTVLEVGGGQPRIFHIPIPRRLLMVLHYRGRDYEFNFSKFWTLTRTKFDCREAEDEIVWNIRTQNLTYRMEIEAHCRKAEMLLINYESPDGERRHRRLWNGGTGHGTIILKERRSGKIIDKMVFYHAGCEWGEYESHSEN